MSAGEQALERGISTAGSEDIYKLEELNITFEDGDFYLTTSDGTKTEIEVHCANDKYYFILEGEEIYFELDQVDGEENQNNIENFARQDAVMNVAEGFDLSGAMLGEVVIPPIDHSEFGS
ncbi:MAG: hypothetical protein RLN62_03030 [Rickettsiales bacterium]